MCITIPWYVALMIGIALLTALLVVLLLAVRRKPVQVQVFLEPVEPEYWRATYGEVEAYGYTGSEALGNLMINPLMPAEFPVTLKRKPYIQRNLEYSIH